MVGLDLSKIFSFVLRLFGLDRAGQRECATLAQVEQHRDELRRAA